MTRITITTPDNIRALLDALDAAEKVQQDHERLINHLNVRLGEEELRSNQMEYERDEARRERDEARVKALEEAAVISEQFTGAAHAAHDMRTGVFPKKSFMGEAIAAAIRALKDRAP